MGDHGFLVYDLKIFFWAAFIPLSSSVASAGLWWIATRRGKIALATLASMLAFSAVDLAMFASLRYFELSFGSARVQFMVMALIRGIVTLAGAMVFLLWLLLRARSNPKAIPSRSSHVYWIVPIILNLGISGCLADGLFIEPHSERLERLTVHPRYMPASSQPIRIVQLSDIHIERWTAREEDAVRMVNALNPDLIFLTGDYLSISYYWNEASREDLHRMIRSLRAQYGIYAVWGNTDEPMYRPHLLDVPNVKVLEDDLITLQINGHTLHVLGLNKRYGFATDKAALSRLIPQMPDSGINILLYHTPDLMPEAAASDKIDLYLTGHTHGGQVRLPFFGALFTASIYGKRYEAGSYQEGRTTLYVNRGLGLEGGRALRIRFLCPPEVTLITLTGEDRVH